MTCNIMELSMCLMEWNQLLALLSAPHSNLTSTRNRTVVRWPVGCEAEMAKNLKLAVAVRNLLNALKNKTNESKKSIQG